MEADDDMVVVIVGDGAEDDNAELLAPIKEEVDVLGDDEIEKLIKKAEMHGEFVNVPVNKEYKDWDSDDDEEYVPEDDIEEDEYGDDDDGSGDEDQNKPRHRMLKPSQRKSFVKELRNQYAELQKDNDALITTLAEIMRNIKPPPPPQDYFIMTGIMFECVKCGHISDTQPAAGRHYQEKHGERYLVCFACGVDFRSTTNLYKHEKRCTAPDAEAVLKARAAALGRRGRARPYALKQLPLDNTKKGAGRERRYGCTQCSASFVSKTYLRSHEMLHRGERPYSCTACPRAYTSLAALSRHCKKHSDEQYICDHCGRPFKVKAALVTHMDTHLPVKPFGCSQCDQRYATKAAMLRHEQRVHLGLPPSCVCKICHKRYPLMSVLKEHMRKAHGLLLMTRRMFFQNLPTLTETQIEQAKVVLKSELEPDNSYIVQPLPGSLPGTVEKSVEVSNEQDYFSDQTYDETPECQFETVCKVEPGDEDDESSNHEITLSDEVLHYLQLVQGGLEDGATYNLVVMS